MSTELYIYICMYVDTYIQGYTLCIIYTCNYNLNRNTGMSTEYFRKLKTKKDKIRGHTTYINLDGIGKC